jgi:hypothetical protein
MHGHEKVITSTVRQSDVSNIKSCWRCIVKYDFIPKSSLWNFNQNIMLSGFKPQLNQWNIYVYSHIKGLRLNQTSDWKPVWTPQFL